ncbi:circularly permuted type 2 ATP-grasp protein [Raineyella sp. LH-20]|uniref:circularly permuted type 2 ATP-grasp protein n=1 Tax=Raineyella sp. LH-20 TaxID=3081204 RepID=UPI002955596A|nr:circularly permuted type 2 ATP-grasp protein [Raineyella sp. LH-20]WOP18709.1 circularly permuted type 2 ATP-grasp protein [Raineyella sp. LH-20]
MTAGRDRAPGPYDEFRAPDGALRVGWGELAAVAEGSYDWAARQREIDRRLADDNVTYRPWSTEDTAADRAPVRRDDVGDDEDEVAEPQPWRLDPLPLVLHSGEWRELEKGLVQRAELLSAAFTDLYGARRLLADGIVPPEVVMGHPGYLRPLIGAPQPRGLFLVGATIGRAADGGWRLRAQETQAPVGAGYAMENRRVLSRVHAELYREADLIRLTPFYQAMRAALVESAPDDVEDPHVVVLTPGTHAATAFDQAFLASRLGFPLVEGSDLVVRDGRVWLRSLDRLEPVDVIFRHVPARATDPLELQPGSRLGVAGLTQAVRRGSVSVVNSLGTGVLENPGLMAFDDTICHALLDEPLRLPSLPTWWCGADSARSHVRTHLVELRIAHIGSGRTWEGPLLSAAERDELTRRIEEEPHLYVGQQRPALSTSPAVRDGRIVDAPFQLTGYLIRHGASYAALPGGLGELVDEPVATTPGPASISGRPTKDLWIVGSDLPTTADTDGDVVAELIGGSDAMVPRVLDDLYWMGRYAERAEDVVRLVSATHHVLVEVNMVCRPGSAVDVLLDALYSVTPRPGDDSSALRQLRTQLVNRSRRGTVARSLARLSHAADGVRDQLSSDVWVVLAGAERVLDELRRADPDDSSRLADAAERSLVALLALNGITAENMVHDAGWQLLDSGRALERAVQVVGLLRSCLTAPALRAGTTADTEGRWSLPPQRMVLTAAMTAAESVVTHRRRHGERPEVAAVLDLLVADPSNPRSVAFQVQRLQRALGRLPHASTAGRPQRLLADLAELTTAAAVRRVCHGEPALVPSVDGADSEAPASAPEPTAALRPQATEPAATLRHPAPGPNPVQCVDDYLTDLRWRLFRVSEAIAEAYLRRAPQPRPLWVSAERPPGPGGGGM